MVNYSFSKHALEKMEERGVSMQIVLAVINNIENVIMEDDTAIHQAIVNF